MQRRYSEPNTYIDTLPPISQNSDELYDDVASIADPEVRDDIKRRYKGDFNGATLFFRSLLVFILNPSGAESHD